MSANEARKNLSPENINFDIPDRAKGENENLKPLSWSRKVSNRILLLDIF
jgi:hypothetical protein